MKKGYIRGWGHLTLRVMPQENYSLIDFDWDESLENLRNSSLVVGDFDDSEIAYTRGVAYARIKVKDEKVSFGLSQYGKLQLSSPNADLLRRAKSQLNKLIVCTRWVPTAPTTEKPSEKYQSIMDLPEAQEADWTKIPKREIHRLNQQFQLAKDLNLNFLLDIVRTTLKSYEKSTDSEKTKSLLEKIKEWLSS
ncbi:MAG: hypothetical protein NWF13_07295 [Candidatus Bathyarchaeota archaeon]|nr:hypothetical protein [Candidatus Bathyarchaeota archaeon]